MASSSNELSTQHVMAHEAFAGLTDAAAFGSYVAALDADMQALQRQHGVLAGQMRELHEEALGASAQLVAQRLPATAARLEMLFARIDNLSDVFDEVQRKLLHLHDVVRHIAAPASVKERASGFLRGILKKKGDASSVDAAAEATWSRVPLRVVVDGSSPEEFRVRFRGVVSDLDSMRDAE
jgi:hypothetical protein